MARKIRVLVVCENITHSTGYAVYGRELLNRLAGQPEIELGALMSFGTLQDVGLKNLPYRVWQAIPQPNEEKEFFNDKKAKFGSFHFNQICLDFQPDCVLSFRDCNNDDFIEQSPFRRFFSWCAMPTCDAEPQIDSWLDIYGRCDKLLSYTDWAGDLMKRSMPNGNNYIGTASPAVDYSVFQPVADKSGHKAKMGLGSRLVVGMVGRNQIRKLFPQLMEVFAKVRMKYYDKNPALYLHTDYPGEAWNIPINILKNGLANSVYLTYTCEVCGHCAPSLYDGPRTFCPKCHEDAYFIINTERGVSRESLANIYNCMDGYVQLSNAGGFEIPIVEAAACGVPVLATDYSAMGDIVRKIRGTPINVSEFSIQPDLERKLAIPSSTDLGGKLELLMRKPENLRRSEGFRTMEACREHFHFDFAAQAWLDAISTCPLRDPSETWLSPVKYINSPQEPPLDCNPAEFAKKCTELLVSTPGQTHSMIRLKIARDSYYTGNRRDVWAKCLAYLGVFNLWEARRKEQLIENPRARDVS